MDRVIKFRGKYIKDGVWIYGGYGYLKKSKKHFITDQRAFFSVIPETIGQFTGFKDIDGKEIYEGDIIQNDEHPEEIGKIINENNCWLVEWFDIDDKACLCWLLENTPQKVIGNIYDNPELLEGKKND